MEHRLTPRRTVPIRTVPTIDGLMRVAERLERAGQLPGAARAFSRAEGLAARLNRLAEQSEALRRLAVVQRRTGQSAEARHSGVRALQAARGASRDDLAAAALNVLGAFDLEAGSLGSARTLLEEAAAIHTAGPQLRARVEQNLGIVANISGDFSRAFTHYRRSLRASRDAGDTQGCARAWHNLGMLGADRLRWRVAARCFRRSATLARSIGDTHLQALCVLNRTEVHLACGKIEAAQRSARHALALFTRLGALDGLAAAHRFVGVVSREIGDLHQAAANLHRARDLAAEANLPLEQAEALRELALVHEADRRNPDALRCLSDAHRLFLRVQADRDLADITRRVGTLEETYLSLVRGWGESIESADRYTYGHCGRVADYAVAVGAALGLDSLTLMTLRVGAYLHDVGKVNVPPEILNKPGRLEAAELVIMRQHPVLGIELLEGIDFPWDIRPIIRWHHERSDGQGYPDQLAGDGIPLVAQVTCVADVFDALTTSRSYRSAMTEGDALREMQRTAHWWHPRVLEAFLAIVRRRPSGVPPTRDITPVSLTLPPRRTA